MIRWLLPHCCAPVANEPRITLRMRYEVTAAATDPATATIEFQQPDGSRQARSYDHVVNALWEDRLLIDQTAGAPMPRPWSFRIKHFLRAAPTRDLAAAPTASIVLGPHGDMVRYSDGSMFLSCYPVGRRDMSSAVRPPA
ncbi:MAG: hypothetical protein ACOYJ6_18930 [Caulobacterales bacterium]